MTSHKEASSSKPGEDLKSVHWTWRGRIREKIRKKEKMIDRIQWLINCGAEDLKTTSWSSW